MNTKLTKKEALLQKKYELENQLRILEGKEPFDLEAIFEHYRFRDEAENARVVGLEADILHLEKAIERQKRENDVKAKTEAYYASEEGRAHKLALEARREELTQEFELLERSSFEEMKRWIKQFLGEHWTVRYLRAEMVKFQMWDDEQHDFVFGSEIEVGAERKCYWTKKERFETNVGSMGSFDICDHQVGRRARFYMDLGKFLSDEARIAELKSWMFDYADRIFAMREEAGNIEIELKNPLAL